jgi:hypothetical protein
VRFTCPFCRVAKYPTVYAEVFGQGDAIDYDLRHVVRVYK